MDKSTAVILVKNVLERLNSADDRLFYIKGPITHSEREALELMLGQFQARGAAVAAKRRAPPAAPDAAPARPPSAPPEKAPPLALQVFDLAHPPEEVRLCMEFGGYACKAAVLDSRGAEESATVLEIGLAGRQDPTRSRELATSLYIDARGRLWLGQAAVEMSLEESAQGRRRRFDGIKHFLLEDKLDSKADPALNPTRFSVTLRELLLAYLAFFTWTVNRGLEALDLPLNLPRRFILPALAPQRRQAVEQEMRALLCAAAVLAESFDFDYDLEHGEPVLLHDFVLAARELRRMRPLSGCSLVTEAVEDAQAAAASRVSGIDAVNRLMMVIDAGAARVEWGLFLMEYDSADGAANTFLIDGSARSLDRGGDFIDRILGLYALYKGGITKAHAGYAAIRNRLALSISAYKEELFNAGVVNIPLGDELSVQVEREEFLATKPMGELARELADTQQEVLEAVTPLALESAPAGELLVALSGGCAGLPLFLGLTQGRLQVRGLRLERVPAVEHPLWLNSLQPELRALFARVAPVIGGARDDALTARHDD